MRRNDFDKHSGDISESTPKDYTINDIMRKLMEMDNKYTDLLRKYEDQVKINDVLKAEMLEIKSQLNKEKNRNEQNELKKNHPKWYTIQEEGKCGRHIHKNKKCPQSSNNKTIMLQNRQGEK